jgi:hypothetical protein
MSQASAVRALHLLLLRDEPAPAEAGEALLFVLNRFPEKLLECMTPGSMLSASMEESVVAPYSQHTAGVFATLGANAADQMQQSIAERVRVAFSDELRKLSFTRRRSKNSKTSLLGRVLKQGADALREGISADVLEPVHWSILTLLACSRQSEIVQAVFAALGKHLHSRCQVDSGGQVSIALDGTGDEGEDQVVRVADILSTACCHDAITTVRCLEAVHRAWREQKADAAMDVAEECTEETKEGASTDLVEARAAPETRKPTVCAETSLSKEWADILNGVGDCVELKLSCTALEAAVCTNSQACIAYLCAQPDVRVLCSLAVSAMAKAQVGEDTVLALLRRAVPDVHSTSAVELEYGSTEEFLATLEHSDMRGQVVVSGETVLHVACRRGFTEVVRHLLSLGADPLVQDEHGCTALSCSVAAGHGRVTHVLYSACPERMKRAVNVLAYAMRKFLLRRPLQKVVVSV